MATAMTPTKQHTKKNIIKNELNNERNEDANASQHFVLWNDLLGTVKHTHKIVQE